MLGESKPTWVIMVFIVLLIGVVLAGPIADQVYLATTGTNITGASATIVNLLPLFFAIVLLMIAVKKL